ncbi:MAG: enoyl-CoA hydratase-related protein [Gammaproteobacteria bacterium]
MSTRALSWTLHASERGTVAHAVIHGEKRLNVVDQAILEDATAALLELLDIDGLRALTLAGPGPDAFVGGANLHALRALDTTTAEPFIRSVHGLCAAIRAADVPVVGVMRGFCLGAGLEIAAACDMRIGDHSVRCGMPEVRVGVPSVVEAALLPGLVGWGKARELMLRGHIIDAAESAAIGILQHLVDAAGLDALAATLCEDFLATTPLAMAAQKRLFTAWEDQSVSDAIETGVAALVAAYETSEPREAVDAFFGARKPRED